MLIVYAFITTTCFLGMTMIGFLIMKQSTMTILPNSSSSTATATTSTSTRTIETTRARARASVRASTTNATTAAATTTTTTTAVLFPELNEFKGYSRAYPVYKYPFPCFPADRLFNDSRKLAHLMIAAPATKGLLFHRPVKTGSTTVAGTIMRIAHTKRHLAKNKNATNTPCCLHRANHGTAYSTFKYHLRDKTKSFLFSILRDPTKMIISKFFHFSISVGQRVPTDAFFQKDALSYSNGNQYIRDLALENVPNPNTAIYGPIVKRIIDGYDFIAITERLDESMVVLKMLLGLELQDILYVRERSQGSFSNGPKERPCLYVWPSFVTKGMETFFNTSQDWKKQVKGDYMLYDAARKSLDLTIDSLGRRNFEQELKRYKAALAMAQEVCAPRAVPICGPDGSRRINTTCYIWGEGCNHACLDEIKLPE